MTARTHDLAAITLLGAVFLSRPLPTMSLSTVLLAIFANQLGGVAPDIDQPTAPLWRNLPIGHLFGRMVDKSLGGHRFLTHSLLGLALFGFLAHALLVFLTPVMPHVNTGYVWWAFIVGMVSHLIMDTFTKEGVPWLLPVPIKLGIPPLKSLRITTGKLAEKGIIFPLLLVAAFLLCAHNYTTLSSFLHNYIQH